jgi:outer membrane protein assembly factor BamB
LQNATRRWSLPLSSDESNLVVTNNVIYVFNGDGVEALHASDGAQMWSHPSGQFTYANGVIYADAVAGGDNTTTRITALNGFTGATLWTSQAVAKGSLVSAGASLLVLSQSITAQGAPGSSTVSVLDVSTGSLRWKQTMTGTGFADDLARGDTLYLGLDTPTSTAVNYQVIAYRLTDGSKEWQSGNIPYFSHLVDVDSNRVYLQTQTALMALQVSDGSVAWTTPMENSSEVLLANNVLYGGKFAGSSSQPGIFALNAATGAQLWLYALGSSPILAAPVLSGGMAYLPTRGGSGSAPQLYALNASSGNVAWSAPNLSSYPSVSNGMVYTAATASANGATVYALDASTGAVKWTYAVGHPLETYLSVIG